MAKKAVLIGINRYRVPGADLRGCVPDVNNMSNQVQQQYGFDATDTMWSPTSKRRRRRWRRPSPP